MPQRAPSVLLCPSARSSKGTRCPGGVFSPSYTHSMLSAKGFGVCLGFYCWGNCVLPAWVPLWLQALGQAWGSAAFSPQAAGLLKQAEPLRGCGDGCWPQGDLLKARKKPGGGLHLNLSLGTSSSCSLVGEKFRLWQCWSSALAAQQFLGSAGHPKSSEPGPGKAIKKKLDLTNPLAGCFPLLFLSLFLSH